MRKCASECSLLLVLDDNNSIPKEEILALTAYDQTKTRNVKDGATSTYAAQVITTNIVKQRSERFNTGRCIFLVKMCRSYKGPASAMRAYEDSYQVSAAIYTKGKP